MRSRPAAREREDRADSGRGLSKILISIVTLVGATVAKTWLILQGEYTFSGSNLSKILDLVIALAGIAAAQTVVVLRKECTQNVLQSW